MSKPSRPSFAPSPHGHSRENDRAALGASVWPWLKQTHVALAALSAAGFCVRAFWLWTRPARLDARWVKIAPHVVDTFLLLSGLTLAISLGYSPIAHAWFAAKLAAIVVYIVLGRIALGRGRSRRARLLALAGALASLAFVFATALTREPIPGL